MSGGLGSIAARGSLLLSRLAPVSGPVSKEVAFRLTSTLCLRERQTCRRPELPSPETRPLLARCPSNYGLRLLTELSGEF